MFWAQSRGWGVGWEGDILTSPMEWNLATPHASSLVDLERHQKSPSQRGAFGKPRDDVIRVATGLAWVLGVPPGSNSQLSVGGTPRAGPCARVYVVAVWFVG